MNNNMKSILRILYVFFIFCVLTVLTQIGGLVYLVYRLLWKRWLSTADGRLIWLKKSLFFIGLYLLATWLLVPPLARQFGRVPLPYSSSVSQPIQPASWLTCIGNRHYVRPVLKKTIIDVAQKLGTNYPNFEIVYLDANFPFWNGFPLLPHKSHNDGRKLDIAFVYQKNDGTLSNGTPSMLGYGVCEKPQKGEKDQPAICAKHGYWQYSLLEQLTSERHKQQYTFDLTTTKVLLQTLHADKNVGKIFIEPHLKQRMGLEQYSKVRFHGCGAVRHDDHIHLQL